MPRHLRQEGVADSRLLPDAQPFSFGREAQEAKALRIIEAELDWLGWDAAALWQASKGAGEKIRLAAQL